MQRKPVNVITVRQRETDNVYQMKAADNNNRD
jgi:hypothetical protein